MFLTIIGFLKSFFEAIPILKKLFTKNPTDSIEKQKIDLRKELDEFEKTGRPPKP